MIAALRSLLLHVIAPAPRAHPPPSSPAAASSSLCIQMILLAARRFWRRPLPN